MARAIGEVRLSEPSFTAQKEQPAVGLCKLRLRVYREVNTKPSENLAQDAALDRKSVV